MNCAKRNMILLSKKHTCGTQEINAFGEDVRRHESEDLCCNLVELGSPHFLGVVHLEDLAANALISLVPDGRTFVSYSALELYGKKVIELLEKRYNEKAVLILSRDETAAMYQRYSDFFKEAEKDNKLGVQLCEGKTVEDLIKEFCGVTPLNLLLMFRNIDALYVLSSNVVG